eukprot:CAMPEP_0184408154 /NCGR_PEP_ID=MMETSP0738-20130409/3009_1 /TAXON_ID=385413 /ORGANISM="Thalassiosira miniscula, Strain CCMP1093" /LENGTH=37 /DNA_ID= /DNA_START= /DNA_END= /DNA_ORIENTATION=
MGCAIMGCATMGWAIMGCAAMGWAMTGPLLYASCLRD